MPEKYVRVTCYLPPALLRRIDAGGWRSRSEAIRELLLTHALGEEEEERIRATMSGEGRGGGKRGKAPRAEGGGSLSPKLRRAEAIPFFPFSSNFRV
jgi:Arc/MetJ-type ribon-helix-helix transcriptional regulator